jgi:hypothetical protein
MSLVINYAPRHTRMEVQIHVFLTHELHRGDWLASSPQNRPVLCGGQRHPAPPEVEPLSTNYFLMTTVYGWPAPWGLLTSQCDICNCPFEPRRVNKGRRIKEEWIRVEERQQERSSGYTDRQTVIIRFGPSVPTLHCTRFKCEGTCSLILQEVNRIRVEVKLHAFLTSTLDGDVWTAQSYWRSVRTWVWPSKFRQQVYGAMTITRNARTPVSSCVTPPPGRKTHRLITRPDVAAIPAARGTQLVAAAVEGAVCNK